MYTTSIIAFTLSPLFFSVGLALPQASPSNTPSTISKPLSSPASTPSTSSTLALPSPSSTTSSDSKATCQAPPTTDSPNIDLTTFTSLATDFCGQLAGEGMFGSKNTLFPLSPPSSPPSDSTSIAVEISFVRSSYISSPGTSQGFGAAQAERGGKCVNMDGEECLRGLSELGRSCSSPNTTLSGTSTQITPCGTYTVTIKSSSSSSTNPQKNVDGTDAGGGGGGGGDLAQQQVQTGAASTISAGLGRRAWVFAWAAGTYLFAEMVMSSYC